MNRSCATRDYSLDNIRFFLIFSVVFAHFLEVCVPFTGSQDIYLFIYTFHMPVFIFLFGYNIKYSPARIIYRWCIPYAVFQSIYIFFQRFLYNASIAIQYTTPYWLLWYMVVCIFYQLLLPLYDSEDPYRQLLSLLCTFILALYIGFEGSVGYYMSLSRFFVFQPWFLLGYYCKKNGIVESLTAHRKIRFTIFLVSMLIILLFAPHYSNIPIGLLYGSHSYSGCGGTPLMRASVSFIAFSWILFLFVGVKPYLNKPLKLLTRIGQNTWPIFLLHGFFVKAIPVYLPQLLSSPWRVILLSCTVLVLMGNKILGKAIYYTGFSWFEKLALYAPAKKKYSR